MTVEYNRHNIRDINLPSTGKITEFITNIRKYPDFISIPLDGFPKTARSQIRVLFILSTLNQYEARKVNPHVTPKEIWELMEQITMTDISSQPSFTPETKDEWQIIHPSAPENMPAIILECGRTLLRGQGQIRYTVIHHAKSIDTINAYNEISDRLPRFEIIDSQPPGDVYVLQAV